MRARAFAETSLLCVAITVGLQSAALAAPSNGTRFPPSRQVELGYQYNVMFARTLDRSYGALKTQDHFYAVSFGAFDWLALDGQIGIGGLTKSGGEHLPGLEFNTGFAGGYGLRIRAFNDRKLGARLIVGAQHICVHPQARSADNDKYTSFLDDWQVSGLAAKDFKFLTVYTGMKGSDCEIVYKINKHDRKRRFSRYHIGLITGAELYLFDNKARIGAEGRFCDETAFTTSVSCLF